MNKREKAIYEKGRKQGIGEALEINQMGIITLIIFIDMFLRIIFGEEKEARKI